MYILGITGNIGSGKTTVSNRFGALGAVISHSDDLAKKILQDTSSIKEQLSLRFGSDILDGSGKLQTRILAERAFSSTEDQQFLNGLIHPEVRKETLSRIEKARKESCPLFVIDAPLLYEAGVEQITDSVLVVVADQSHRQQRNEAGSGIQGDDFERRDKLQLSIEEKIKRADHTIYNNGSLKDLFENVDVLFHELTR